MAITGTISVDNTVIIHGQKLLVTLTLFNPAGGTADTVLRVEPYVLLSSTTPPAAINGTPQFEIGSSQSVAASSTVNSTISMSWYESLFSPQKPSSTGSAFTVGAVAYLASGSTVSASQIVNVYPLTSDGITPQNMPGTAQLRFDANTESSFIAAVSYHSPM